MIDQQQRADAYHRNLIATLFGARCEYLAEVGKDGDLTVRATSLRMRMRDILVTIETVEAA